MKIGRPIITKSLGVLIGALMLRAVAVAQEPPRGEYRPGPVVSLAGPLSSYKSIAVTPDARTVAAGDGEGRIRLWESERVAVPREFRGRPLTVEAMTLSRDGRRLAVSGPARKRPAEDLGEQFGIFVGFEGAVIDIWEVTTGRRLAALDPPGIPYGLAFDRSGDHLAAVLSGETATLAVWSVDRGNLIQDRGGPANLQYGLFLGGGDGRTTFDANLTRAVAFELKQLAQVRFWPAGRGRPVDLTINQEGPELTGCALDGDGNRLAVIDAEQTLHVATTEPLALVRSGRKPERQPRNHPFPVNPPAAIRPLVLAFDPTGRRVVAGVADGSLRIYDPATAEVREIVQGPSTPVRAIAFQEGRIRVVAGGWSTVEFGLAKPTPLVRWEAVPPLGP